MDKSEYLSGLPEVGIVPRAPHVGPLLRELYEQEHGRGVTSPRLTGSRAQEPQARSPSE